MQVHVHDTCILRASNHMVCVCTCDTPIVNNRRVYSRTDANTYNIHLWRVNYNVGLWTYMTLHKFKQTLQSRKTFGTYRIVEQRELRWVCAYNQTHKGLRCSHTPSTDIDEDSDENVDVWPRLLRQHFRLLAFYAYAISIKNIICWPQLK